MTLVPARGFGISKSALTLVLVGSVGLNVLLAVVLGSGDSEPAAASPSRDSYPYLASRIFVAAPNAPLISFDPLRRELIGYADNVELKLGVYFQYLPTGISVGFHADEPFISSSLLKVPTVMKVYKLIEEGVVRKTDEMVITREALDPNYGELWKRGIGAVVTVEEAISASLRESDNTAHRLLYALSRGRPTELYNYLDVPVGSVGGEAAVTPRNYTSIFRSLFFSSYLSVEHSNEVLELLSRTSEADVLRGDIPRKIRIAQKYGVAYMDAELQRAEFRSYCGLFYVPQRPYTLCVMAAGDSRAIRMVVEDISEMVYEFVSTAEARPPD